MHNLYNKLLKDGQETYYIVNKLKTDKDKLQWCEESHIKKASKISKHTVFWWIESNERRIENGGNWGL